MFADLDCTDSKGRDRLAAASGADAVALSLFGTADLKQNVPSTAQVAAGDFGFLTLIQVFDGPER
jgi:hypothetical protein